MDEFRSRLQRGRAQQIEQNQNQKNMSIENRIHRKAESYVAALQNDDEHDPLDSPRPVGRPPISGETADGQIQLRVTMSRKNAYVRAAKPQKLTAWIFQNLDKAAKYEPK